MTSWNVNGEFTVRASVDRSVSSSSTSAAQVRKALELMEARIRPVWEVRLLYTFQHQQGRSNGLLTAQASARRVRNAQIACPSHSLSIHHDFAPTCSNATSIAVSRLSIS